MPTIRRCSWPTTCSARAARPRLWKRIRESGGLSYDVRSVRRLESRRAEFDLDRQRASSRRRTSRQVEAALREGARALGQGRLHPEGARRGPGRPAQPAAASCAAGRQRRQPARLRPAPRPALRVRAAVIDQAIEAEPGSGERGLARSTSIRSRVVLAWGGDFKAALWRPRLRLSSARWKSARSMATSMTRPHRL